jgi:hypothetical protein
VRMLRSSTASYYHGDAFHSIEKLTTSSGTVAESLEYTAFGKPSITASSVGNAVLWQSQWYDYALKLDAKSRPYDSHLTFRFIVADGGSSYVRSTNGKQPLAEYQSTQHDCRFLTTSLLGRPRVLISDPDEETGLELHGVLDPQWPDPCPCPHYINGEQDCECPPPAPRRPQPAPRSDCATCQDECAAKHDAGIMRNLCIWLCPCDHGAPMGGLRDVDRF